MIIIIIFINKKKDTQNTAVLKNTSLFSLKLTV